MRRSILIGQSLWTFFACANANVEKRIFLAPAETTILHNQLNLDQLQLDTLTPTQPVLRSQLTAAFPTESKPQGPTSWFLLDSLNQHQRYELRVCWLATIDTAADYFTSNTTLMRDVSLVDVDISMPDPSPKNFTKLTQRAVLDPYHLNIYPKSLVPIGLHLAIIAILAWHLSKAIWSLLDRASRSSHSPKSSPTQQKKES
ncbi:MAG: hypothetical protein LQ348_002995 [Seirophora lacunosa]|nr:MAG: hypothetical protein LQ348_002995 [Seirophora lacunosa]